MENGLQKKYGLITAICMVVGIVVGSGVFFKAQTILQKTEGNMVMGIWAWLIGGAIMLCCIWAFSIMATKYEKVNGIVDYAEAIKKTEVKGGVYEGKAIDANVVKNLASTPSKEQSLARLMGSLNSPISSFVRALDAIRKQKEEATA